MTAEQFVQKNILISVMVVVIKPYWRINAGLKENLTYCPYCGKKIDYSKINKEIDYD